MARERMVTRTVVVTMVEVMCVNVETAEVQVNTYELSGTYADAETALKATKKVYETATFKCVAVQGMSEKEVLYGMKEIDFIRLAKVLPPRNTNSTETEE